MKKTTILCSLALAIPAWAERAATFEETLAKVAAYEVGDSQIPLADLDRLVGAASSSPEQVKRMEQAFLKALAGGATLAGKDQICRHLRIVGSAASVPALAGMLGSDETADMARYALERIPGEAVNQALRAMLAKTSGRVKVGIVNTLGRRRDAAAVAALGGLIPGEDAAVAAAAAAALGEIASPAAAAALAAARPRASGALRTEIGEASLRCAEQMAEAGDRKGAFAIFQELNAPSEPVMVRVGALRGLAGSGGREAVPALRAAMKAGEPKIQAQAIRQLSALPGAEVTAALSQALAGMDTVGKVRVLAALADRGDQGALPALLSAVKDQAEPVRVAALLGLGKLGDASVVLLLAETAAQGAGAAAQSAAPEAGAVRTGGLPNEKQIPPDPAITGPTAARESLARLRGAEINRAVIAGITAADPKVKIELIQAASARGLSAATETLIRTAADPNGEVRRAALRALRDTSEPSHLPALIDLLAKSQAAPDRADAVRAISSALRRSETASLGPVMSAYRSASDPGLRGSLLTVLGQTGRDESLPVLRGALNEDNAELRRGAILALSEWPNATPMPDLLAIARSDPNPVFQALSLRGVVRLIGLGENRPPAETVRMLAEAMSLARQAEVKKAILSQVQQINSKEALSLAEEAMNDPEVAAEAKLAADRIRQRLSPMRKRQ